MYVHMHDTVSHIYKNGKFPVIFTYHYVCMSSTFDFWFRTVGLSKLTALDPRCMHMLQSVNPAPSQSRIYSSRVSGRRDNESCKTKVNVEAC